MPMIILSIRVEIDIIFKLNYRSYLGNKHAIMTKDQGPNDYGSDILKNQSDILRLLNGVITELYDPNIMYSRLSFFESGKDAIDIKTVLK